MTSLITDQILDEARQYVQAAEEAMDRARHANSQSQMVDARDRYDRASGSVRRLSEQQAAQLEALAARSAVEKKHAKAIKTIGGELQVSAAALADAIESTNLREIIAAVEHHHAVISAAHDQLTALELCAVTDLVEFEAGHSTGSGAKAVKISGVWWMALPLDGILARLIGLAVRPVLGPNHHLVKTALFHVSAQRLDARQDGLLDELARRGCDITR